mmetsp:Transcript_6991/g.26122  ORF Transcript_6991/g.26122 Transcript_6991/m.26122 type:complete len:332 (-) Transcript_6991:232-1227(-)|eukprot:CAMPEP_0117445072 /NCGR_PEP_ID=MMETSP0759-20121206/5591_1 /TAXON_ID=63605 /ORGANISM="Percolomonas cosmopolitus, Strain WS" /LENGTH=331 /DNA_ID=CAMNT_0005237205 /DNA_START=42 /DNA_END=1037 /DNA_ORIENTATION=+
MSSSTPSFPIKLSPQKQKLLIVLTTLTLSALFLLLLFKDSNNGGANSGSLSTGGSVSSDTTLNQAGANYNKYYSKYYDVLYKDKDYNKEVRYLHDTIQKYLGDAKGRQTKDLNVLELGCGTGKHAYLLNKNHGYPVHGVDMSPEMVKHAQDKYAGSVESGAVTYGVGDARSYRDPSSRKYEVVLSLFHVVSYQITNQHLLDEFRTAKEHLKPNGVFIFDVWYGPTVLTDRPTKRVKKMENDEVSVVRHASPDLHPNINAVDVNYHIEVTDKKTGEKAEFDEKHPMRYLFKPELEFLLQQMGIELITMEEWVTGKEPGFDTWGVTAVGALRK